jgi:hypothetical protein
MREGWDEKRGKRDRESADPDKAETGSLTSKSQAFERAVAYKFKSLGLFLSLD